MHRIIRSVCVLPVVAMAVALFAAGCAEAPSTSPRAADPNASAPAPRSVAHGPATAPRASAAAPAWYAVAQQWVYPLQDRHVAGSRYDVHVLPGSLAQPANMMVQEYDPNVVDFQLLPHGTKFLVPLTVSIDYRGTSCDPQSPAYDGHAPSLLWLDPSSGLWVPIVGVDDPLTRHYTVVLTHFSRYALANAGTGEW